MLFICVRSYRVVTVTLLSLSSSFYTSGPEWHEETQHTGSQEVLVSPCQSGSFSLHLVSSGTWSYANLPSAFQPLWPAQNIDPSLPVSLSLFISLSLYLSLFFPPWITTRCPLYCGTVTLMSRNEHHSWYGPHAFYPSTPHHMDGMQEDWDLPLLLALDS